MIKRSFLALAFAIAMAPAVAHTEDYTESINILDCGQVQNSNGSWQYGSNLWLEYLVETRGLVNLCGQWVVAVDAWVGGVSGSGASSGARVLTATVRRQIPVPYSGTWVTSGQHWATVAFWPFMLSSGATSSQAVVQPPRVVHNPEYQCYQMGGSWNGWSCELANCPIIVDTNRDGYRLTSVEDGVLFDLNADGTPERVAWTERDSDDAFLVMDRNGNGRIDDGTELFGNHTPAFNDRLDVTTANGFEALKFMERPSYGPSYLDSRIDDRDAVFSRLYLWRDLNHNGISEPEELQPLSESGLVSISTDYRTAKRRDRYGNEFRQRAMGLWADGEEHHIYDVWLRFRH